MLAQVTLKKTHSMQNKEINVIVGVTMGLPPGNDLRLPHIQVVEEQLFLAGDFEHQYLCP